MTLIFDARDELRGKPGFHALIAGVSHYPHLPGGGGERADDAYGLRQLSSTALTAYRVYRWLTDPARRDRLPLPLATVRLLLSPSAAELDAEPGMKDLADRCTRANFARAAKDWRKDSRGHADGCAFFYFAGHGMQRRKDDAVMLLDDFGDPDEGPLHAAAAADHLFNGMAPPASITDTVARRQMYFVDACRNVPPEVRRSEWMNVPDLWRIELGGVDDRRAPIFYAALPGDKAYALVGEQTLFSKALIECLDGAGGVALDEENDDGDPRYGITVHSLNEALQGAVERVNKAEGGRQSYVLSGLVRNDLLFRLDGPPEVDVTFEIDPIEALGRARLEVTDATESGVRELFPIDPHPYADRLPAGYYRFRVRVDPPEQSYRDYVKWRPVKPPRCAIKARLTS